MGCSSDELVCHPEGRLVVPEPIQATSRDVAVLALDEERVYWVDGGDGSSTRVAGVPRAGGEVEVLAEIPAGADELLPFLVAGGGAIHAVSAGGVVVRAAAGEAAVELGSIGEEPRGLTLVGDDLYIAGLEQIWRLPRSGGEPTLFAGPTEPVMALAPAGDAVLVRHLTSLLSYPIAGGEPTLVAAVDAEEYDAPPVVVGDEIYLRVDNCWVGRVPLAGGDVVQVSPEDDRCVRSFAARPGRLDLGYAVRISDGHSPGPDQPAEYETLECGAILELEPDTAASVDIAGSQELPLALAADASGVFWWSSEDGASVLRARP